MTYVHVYRSSLGDCTNSGISSKHDSFKIVDNAEEAAKSKIPCLKLVRRKIQPHGDYLHLEPFSPPKGIGWMFGGNFAYTSDSRFPSRYPIPIHDRQETEEEYRLLSI